MENLVFNIAAGIPTNRDGTFDTEGLVFNVCAGIPTEPAPSIPLVLFSAEIGSVVGTISDLTVERTIESSIDMQADTSVDLTALRTMQTTLSINMDISPVFNVIRGIETLIQSEVAMEDTLSIYRGFIVTIPHESAIVTTLIKIGDVFLISPEYSSVDESRPVSFTWGDTGVNTTYQLQVAEDSEFSTIVIDEELETNSYTDSLEILKPAKLYYWRVRAK